MKFRFGIAAMMVLILLAALAFAAIRHASTLLASGLYTLAVVALATALLRGVARRDMGWVGSGIFGWAYLQTCFGGNPPQLLTGHLLGLIQPDPQFAAGATGGQTPGWIFYSPSSAIAYGQTFQQQVIHTFMAVLFAALGFVLGRRFAGRRKGDALPAPGGGAQ